MAEGNDERGTMNAVCGSAPPEARVAIGANLNFALRNAVRVRR